MQHFCIVVCSRNSPNASLPLLVFWTFLTWTWEQHKVLFGAWPGKLGTLVFDLMTIIPPSLSTWCTCPRVCELTRGTGKLHAWLAEWELRDTCNCAQQGANPPLVTGELLLQWAALAAAAMFDCALFTGQNEWDGVGSRFLSLGMALCWTCLCSVTIHQSSSFICSPPSLYEHPQHRTVPDL